MRPSRLPICLSWLYLSIISPTLANPLELIKFASIVGGTNNFAIPTATFFNAPATTILPNGGPTVTYTPTQSAASNIPKVTSYLTTVTYPSGPTVVRFTSSTILPSGTPPDAACTDSTCIPTIYTTGFLGFTLVTTTSVTRYVTTTQLPNGQIISVPTTSSTVLTRAYSGVQHVGLTTFLVGSTVTETQTAVVNGQLTTITATSLKVEATTSAFPVDSGGRNGRRIGSVGAVVAAGAAALVYL